MACIICVIFISACIADKNMEGNNLSTGSSIESNTAGSITTANGTTTCVTETAEKSDKNKIIQTDNINTLRYANNRNIYAGNGKAGISQYDLNGKIDGKRLIFSYLKKVGVL